MNAERMAVLFDAVGHPTRLLILAALEKGPSSPTRIAATAAVPLGSVAYHMRVLDDAAVVSLVRTEPVRGAVEHYYELGEWARRALAFWRAS